MYGIVNPGHSILGMRTGGTGTVKEQFVVKRAEAARQFRLYLRRTTFELIHFSAAVAQEVMVMRLAGNLVPGGLAG